jgi:hypothetical protein
MLHTHLHLHAVFAIRTVGLTWNFQDSEKSEEEEERKEGTFT